MTDKQKKAFIIYDMDYIRYYIHTNIGISCYAIKIDNENKHIILTN